MMRAALLLTSVALAGMASAQIFQSGFEDWTDGAPDGWTTTGVTSIGAANIQQVTENPHSGSSAVRLTNATSSHKRFATQELEVTNGTEYTVTFWVRGTGDIRVGLFDGRSTGSGYAPYTEYSAATSAWTQVTKTIAAATDTAAARFILSVRNTAAPENIVVDDVNISAGGSIPEVSIHDIQFTTDPSGDSPYRDQVVTTSGIVTGSYLTYNNNTPPEPQYRYTYIQDGSGPWNGIVIYDFYNNNNEAAIGDAVTVTATVDEHFGLTELNQLQAFNITATGQPGPAPLVIETGDLEAEALESVLVQVQQATCTLAPSGASYGKWNVDDGSGEAVVGKLMYTVTPAPEVGQVFNVTGVVSFTNFQNNPEYNIQPRVAADVDFITAVQEQDAMAGVAVGPNPAQDVLNVHLGNMGGKPFTYTLVDMQGRTVQSGQLSGSTAQLHVQGLPIGRYQLNLRNSEAAKSFAVQVTY